MRAIVSIDAKTARRCCDIAATAPSASPAITRSTISSCCRWIVGEPRRILERQEADAVELRLRVLDRAPDAGPSGHRDEPLVHAVVERNEGRVVAARGHARLFPELAAQFPRVGAA